MATTARRMQMVRSQTQRIHSTNHKDGGDCENQMTKHEGTGGGAPKTANVGKQALRALRAGPGRKSQQDEYLLTARCPMRKPGASAALVSFSGSSPRDQCLGKIRLCHGWKRWSNLCEYLPVTKGMLCGQRMRLLPFQVEFLRMIYGADPQPKLAVQSLPRGNGKTGLTTGLVLCHLLGPEAEERGEIRQCRHNAKAGGDYTCRGSGDHTSSAGVLGAVQDHRTAEAD